MNDDEVPVAFYEQCVVEHAFEIYALHRLGPFNVCTLQSVVHRLRDREELVAAVDHLPFRVDAEILQQRDMGGQQLGDPAAVRSGVHVEHAGAT